MASKKCKICGKYGVLTQEGICPSCKSLQIYEENDAELAKDIEEEYDPTLSEKLKEDFASFLEDTSINEPDRREKVQNPIVKAKKDFLHYLGLSEKEKQDFILQKICEKYHYDGEFLRRYRPQIKKLSLQYGAAILDGQLEVTLINGMDSNKNFIVKDIIGPMVVYTPDMVVRQGIKVQMLKLDSFVKSKDLNNIDSKMEEIEEHPDNFNEK